MKSLNVSSFTLYRILINYNTLMQEIISTIVDAQLKRRLKENNVESYFAGNPVCKVDKSLDCKPLCSKYCWSRKAANNGYCDLTCNSQSCGYDNGENSGSCGVRPAVYQIVI